MERTAIRTSEPAIRDTEDGILSPVREGAACKRAFAKGISKARECMEARQREFPRLAHCFQLGRRPEMRDVDEIRRIGAFRQI